MLIYAIVAVIVWVAVNLFFWKISLDLEKEVREEMRDYKDCDFNNTDEAKFGKYITRLTGFIISIPAALMWWGTPLIVGGLMLYDKIQDLKKKLKISKMCEQLLSSLENQYEQLNEEKRELRAVYGTKVNAVAAEDMEELIEERQAVRDEETHRARAELLAKYGEAFKDRFFDEAFEKVDCEMQGKVYVKREQAIESQEGAKLSPEQKSR